MMPKKVNQCFEIKIKLPKNKEYWKYYFIYICVLQESVGKPKMEVIGCEAFMFNVCVQKVRLRATENDIQI